MTEREEKNLRKLHRNLADCTMFLKKNGDFPLEEKCEIALFGRGARYTIHGGTGSGEASSRFSMSVEKGLESAGFTITTKTWLNRYDAYYRQKRENFVREIKQRAKEHHMPVFMESMGAIMPEADYDIPLKGAGDVAIYVLSRVSGEGSDRDYVKGDILLSDTEILDILTAYRSYKKFLLVLNVGGPVDLSPVMDVENILLLSQLGATTGRALAEIILGNRNPSGKLTTTWIAKGQQSELAEFGDKDDVMYKEGVYVGYRYYDTVGEEVLFPFGYGLSYTDFEIGGSTLTVSGDTAYVEARVRNTGAFSGREVVQVYVSSPQGSIDKPYQSLCGFEKTPEIEPGEEASVTVEFRISDLASFDSAMSEYVLEPGAYVVRVGNSSRDTQVCGVLTIDRYIVTRRVRHALGYTGFGDFVPIRRPETEAGENLTGVPHVAVDPDAIKTEEIDYDRDQELSLTAERLSNDELIYLNIGAFDPRGGVGSVIGNAAKRVAGAAGETTDKLVEKSIPSLVMADGPAGLRLTPKYWRDEKGAYGLTNPIVEGMKEFMPKHQVAFLNLIKKKPRRGATIFEQYTTAIPIGTALAQTFDRKFGEMCGDIVGQEMQELGVNLWLAPALNIHRTIRCGRNFEYYSEDPFLSGMMAAAVCKGVARHKGCGVTLKHFAANNQEYNRFTNNSVVSERAMREIYLKSFELCIREAHPAAIMSSYNLLNGVHTSERRDLLEDVLRSEFGFDGIVMTDWLVDLMKAKDAKYPAASAERVAAAGGELVMPGNKSDFDKMKKALAAGRLTRKQLMINATRMLAMIKKLEER